MSQLPQIVVLCSGRLGVPTIQRLATLGALAAVATPDTDPKATALLEQLAGSVQVPFYLLSRKSLVPSLQGICARHQPEAVFSIGFPWRIPEAVLSVPPAGFLNFHGGPLPELRGPDPIFEAIRQQLPETALVVHRMDAGFDTGPVVLESRFPLAPGITHGLLSTQLAFQAAELATRLLEPLQQPPLPERPQGQAGGPYWPRVAPVDLYLRWQSQTAGALAALIRACNPIYGGAATLCNGWLFRMTDAAVMPGVTHNAPPGMLLETSPERGALVQCLNGEVLQVSVIGTDEGYFPGSRLPSLGVSPGVSFQDPS